MSDDDEKFVECRATVGERPSDVARRKYPSGYSWCGHDQSGGRAAQRRLRQMRRDLAKEFAREHGYWPTTVTENGIHYSLERDGSITPINPPLETGDSQ